LASDALSPERANATQPRGPRSVGPKEDKSRLFDGSYDD
jgi:hypothetical protein